MIKENVKKLLSELSPHVKLCAACKTRTAEEIIEAIEAGIEIIGENYVREAEAVFNQISGHRSVVSGRTIRFHFIGHLQTNKVKKAVETFDMIETVDSLHLAKEINKRCKSIGKIMEVLIEINSGREEQKTGVFPEEAETLIRETAKLENIQIKGLMTMGPFSDNPEDSRPCFVETKKVFDKIKPLSIPRVQMEVLSMGMSSSYRIAIKEGANLVRIGTAIFGERGY